MGVGVELRVTFKNFFGVYTILFSMFPSILSYDFNLILGLFFLLFWSPKELFSGSGYDLKSVFGSTLVIKQLSFSVIPSILTFEIDLILG